MTAPDNTTQSDSGNRSNAVEQAKALAAAADVFAPPETVEPVDEDPEGDRIEFVRTGVIRAWVGGKRYRLRRPFFGELRQLRHLHEDARDEIEDNRVEMRELSAALKAEAEAIKEKDKDRAEKIKAIRVRSRDLGREMDRVREDAWLGWWVEVFNVLSLDDSPDQLPAWADDEFLITKVVTHWRTVPLGRGA